MLHAFNVSVVLEFLLLVSGVVLIIFLVRGYHWNKRGRCFKCGAPLDPEPTICPSCKMDFTKMRSGRKKPGGRD